MRIIILVSLLAGLAACNTVEGVGRDISGTARGVKNAL